MEHYTCIEKKKDQFDQEMDEVNNYKIVNFDTNVLLQILDIANLRGINLKFKTVQNTKSFIDRLRLLGKTCTVYNDFVIVIMDFDNLEHAYDVLVVSQYKINIAINFSDTVALEKIDLSGCYSIDPKCVYRLFAGCTYLTHVNLGKLDLSKAKSAEAMFFYTYRLKQIKCDGEYLDLSGCTTLDQMFYNSGTGAGTFDIFKKIKTSSKLKTIEKMFKSSKFNEITFGDEFDTSGVECMHELFSYCNDLEKVTYGKKFKTNNVLTFNSTFFNCSKLYNNDRFIISNIDTSNLVNVHETFSHMSMRELIIENIDTHNVKVADNCFDHMTVGKLVLRGLNLSNIHTISNIFNESKIGFLDLSTIKFNYKAFECASETNKKMLTNCEIHTLNLRNQRLTVKAAENLFSAKDIVIHRIILTEGIDPEVETVIKNKLGPEVSVIWTKGKPIGSIK